MDPVGTKKPLILTVEEDERIENRALRELKTPAERKRGEVEKGAAPTNKGTDR